MAPTPEPEFSGLVSKQPALFRVEARCEEVQKSENGSFGGNTRMQKGIFSSDSGCQAVAENWGDKEVPGDGEGGDGGSVRITFPTRV